VKNMHTHKVVITSMLLVLFGSTIFQSCQSVDTSAVIYDLRFDATGFGTTFVTQHQNVTYEGDLFVNNNETFAIQDSEFYMKGKITVQDTSTLIIRKSEFTAFPLEDQRAIVLEDQAELIVENSTLISNKSFFCEIVVQNDAVLNISHSELQNWWEVGSFDEAEIHVNNSTFTSGDIYHDSGIGTFGTSSVTVEDSTIDGVWIWDDSTVSIKNSVIGRARVGGVTNVNITDSKIEIINTGVRASVIVRNSTVTWRAELSFDSSVRFIESSVANVEAYGNSSVRFTMSSVAKIEAHGNANIMLIDSHAGTIETYDDATVLVGWHLPLSGLVTMDHTWVPIIRAIIIITLIAIIIAVLVFFFRKRRAKQDQRKRARTPEAKNIYRTVVCPSCKKRFPEEHNQCPWCGKILLKCKRCGKHISSLEAERYKNYCIECYRQWLQEKTPFF